MDRSPCVKYTIPTIANQKAEIDRISRALLDAYTSHEMLRRRLSRAYRRAYRQRRRAELWRARALR